MSAHDPSPVTCPTSNRSAQRHLWHRKPQTAQTARFDSPQKLTAYFGLVPRVYQSAERCHHGHIIKQGRSQARWLAVEAAQSMVQSGAPLTASYHRIRRKKSHNVAVVAPARKLVVVVWHLLTHQEPYRYAPTKRTRTKLRRVTPGLAAAKIGCIPSTLEAVYAEIGLPLPRAATAGKNGQQPTTDRASLDIETRKPKIWLVPENR